MNHTLYLDKPGAWSSHSWIVGRLSRLAEGRKVLDVGTATGTIGRMCKGKGLILDGIEPNPAWADVARPYYNKVEVKTLETCSEQFLSGHHAVVCADVLEHMKDPESALNKLIALQDDACFFIISVPNIANIWIRLNLLFGHFDYTDRGILDRTHLRFFTRRTARRMIENAGLAITASGTTPIPLDMVSPFFEKSHAGHMLNRMLKMFTGIFPAVFGYQFVFEAVRRRS